MKSRADTFKTEISNIRGDLYTCDNDVKDNNYSMFTVRRLKHARTELNNLIAEMIEGIEIENSPNQLGDIITKE